MQNKVPEIDMSDIHFDRYYRYEELSRALQSFCAAHPDLLRLHSLGRSHEGREIWLVTATHFATGPDWEKPAFWVDGNVHAAELAGSMACLHLIVTLVQGYGRDPDVTRCLDTRAFYICPRINPDGAELALADVPRLIRSGTRAYPYAEDHRGGLEVQDIDRDGRILTMRLRDPDGNWKAHPSEPRLLVPREPAEGGGEYYRLLPEGLIQDYDGALIPLARKKEGLDFNRNFPAQWRPECEQAGAGDFPASEPEVRAVMRFIADHSNICGGVAYHSYSGVLLRPSSYKSDDDLPPEDVWTFRKLGAKGTEFTGYPAASAYHEFRYHPKEIITGALDDWLYEGRGVYAWTCELWSPQRRAGIGDYHYIDWYREHPPEHDLKLLAWNDTELGGAGFVDWYAYQHPQLGPVELGGWAPLYSFWNPPPALLESEIAPFARWLVWHNLVSPRLELLKATAEPLGCDLWRVQLVIRNTGWLPSYVTKHALDKKMLRGVMCEIEIARDAELMQGARRMELGQLEGRAYKPSAPLSFGGMTADPTSERAKAEWVVRAPAGGKITLTARHERAGVVRAVVELPS